MRLAITPTRMDLLRDIAAGHVARIDGRDINLRTGGQVTGWIGDLGTGGWAALDPTPRAGTDVRYWQPTGLGQGYLSVRIADYGTYATVEAGPESSPARLGEMWPVDGLPGRYQVTVGATTLVVTGRPAAIAELRHQAAAAYAAIKLATATATATADTATCARCQIEPARGACCTSHGRQLCHLCYRRTHWVEVCVEGCQDCAAEGLPVRLPNRRELATADPTRPGDGA